jgi:hypothetical protein
MPKRMGERLGHVTRAERASVSATQMVGEVKPPRLPSGMHPIARRWFNALRASGQSQYYEPSDWEAAVFVAEAITRTLNTRRFSSQAFAAVWQAMGDLLTTEADRRRVKIEVERVDAAPVDDRPTALDEYRKALSQ